MTVVPSEIPVETLTEEPAPRPRAPEPIPVDLVELMVRHYPDDPGICACGILIRRGLAVMGGAPKLGKSSLMKNFMLRRAVGATWLGYATTTGTTLYLNAEVPEAQLQKRVGVMLRDADEIPAGAVYFVTDRNLKLDRPEGLTRLRAHIERVKPDLLVIDPLARFMTGDENGTRDMGALVAVLDLLIQEYDLTVVVVHHTGKPGLEGREGGHRLRGSSALYAAADTVLMLDRADTGFKLSFELRHGAEPEPLYLTRTPSLWFVPAGPPEELLAVAWLVHSGPLRPTQLMEAIRKDRNVSPATAWRLLDKAKKAHLIAPDADGYYSSTLTYSQTRGESKATRE